MNQIIYNGDGMKNVLFRTHQHKRFYFVISSEARSRVLMILSLLKARSQETRENDRVIK